MARAVLIKSAGMKAIDVAILTPCRLYTYKNEISSKNKGISKSLADLSSRPDILYLWTARLKAYSTATLLAKTTKHDSTQNYGRLL